MSKEGKRLKAIVVGAGVGGTSTAARLAHAGFDVEVYEKNDFSGGRCSLIHHDGYRFDQGPSLLLLPPLFHEIYNDLGTTLEDQLDLVQCNPNYVIHYHDGEKVTLSSNRALLSAEIEKWDGPGGAIRLEEFLREAGHHCDLSYNIVLNHAFPSIFTFLRPDFLKNLFLLHAFGSLWGRCARYFKTERIRRAFSFGSMYLGSSPFDAPGTYSLLQWTETCEGIWYPKGGFHAVVQSLLKIAESYGARFHFSSPVARVLHDGKRATGIELESGEQVSADIVVVNSDLVWSYNNLFKGVSGAPTSQKDELLDPKKAKTLLEKPHSCSSISFYWAMNEKIPSLNAHNIFLAEEYKASFDDIFKRKSMPREPSFYVNVPSRVDPSAAPPDKDAMVVLVPVGHLLPPGASDTANDELQNWPALVDQARRQVIEVMEQRLGVTDLKSKIAWEDVNTPVTWKEKFNLTHGSILGITHDFFNVLAFRHQAKHPKLDGAYFVGASAHPGTGVPIAIAGSKLCTRQILSDLSIPTPSTYSAGPPRKTSTLDRPRRPSPLYVLEDIAVAAWPFVLGALFALAAVATYTVLRPEIARRAVAFVHETQGDKDGLDGLGGLAWAVAENAEYRLTLAAVAGALVLSQFAFAFLKLGAKTGTA
ncbi:hypothetical protein Q5752_001100 [Cryptotrichosporon argae]